jgi:hypothetical protein
MSPASIKLHESLIRLMKGVISAWEEWLNSYRR